MEGKFAMELQTVTEQLQNVTKRNHYTHVRYFHSSIGRIGILGYPHTFWLTNVSNDKTIGGILEIGFFAILCVGFSRTSHVIASYFLKCILLAKWKSQTVTFFSLFSQPLLFGKYGRRPKLGKFKFLHFVNPRQSVTIWTNKILKQN